MRRVGVFSSSIVIIVNLPLKCTIHLLLTAEVVVFALRSAIMTCDNVTSFRRSVCVTWIGALLVDVYVNFQHPSRLNLACEQGYCLVGDLRSVLELREGWKGRS